MLKPGGRFAVSDVVVRGEVPVALRKSMELWVGCVAGALSDQDYLAKLTAAGFENPDIEVTRVYSVEGAKDFLPDEAQDLQQLAQQVDGEIVSGFIRASKPLGGSGQFDQLSTSQLLRSVLLQLAACA